MPVGLNHGPPDRPVMNLAAGGVLFGETRVLFLVDDVLDRLDERHFFFFDVGPQSLRELATQAMKLRPVIAGHIARADGARKFGQLAAQRK